MSIVEFRNVSKLFTLHTDRSRSFQEAVVNRFQRRKTLPPDVFWALHDVSFEVQAGETFALIGENGSGKSTALKLISRIIYPTDGEVITRGRVAALLELGAGFHPDLTGRENVFLNGSILGLNRTDIRSRLDQIVSFAELERFIDVPIRNFSSGMLMRLGFSVATAFQPDVLLVDEVLAVGDQVFQSRCLRRINEIQQEGATIILVTHDLTSVRNLCQRAVWLDEGRMMADGPTEDVAAQYLGSLWKEQDRDEAAEASKRAESDDKRWGSGEVRIESVEMLDETGKPTDVFHTDRPITIRMKYNARRLVRNPAFGISLYDEKGNRINGPNSVWDEAPIEEVKGEGYVDYSAPALPLLAGRYSLTVAVYDRNIAHPYDHWHHMMSFVVVRGNTARQDGTTYIPCSWQHHPAAVPAGLPQ